MAVYVEAPDGCWYQTKGDGGYYSGMKAWIDPVGWGLHKQGAVWNVSHKCWVPPGKEPGRIVEGAGTAPPNTGGGGVGFSTGETAPPGGSPPGGSISPYLIPGILAGIGIIGTVLFVRRKR